MMDANALPLAVYVHWPWCLSKCPYCDFNSRPVDPADFSQAPYRAAVLAELYHYAEQTKGRPVGSIFFGGGTPSLMAPETAAAVIEAARAAWAFRDDIEITLEANPTSIEAAKFRAFRDAGINRVSVGVQALDDEALRALGREHSVAEAVRALDIAAAIFKRFSFDMIYARPGQTLPAWRSELARALDMAGGHISLYQLTVEPGTAFFRQGVAEAHENLGLDLYRLTQDMTGAAGLPAYEISNHARPGEESRHNLAYWHGADYVGLGPGAHGRLTRDGVTAATYQIADPARWLDVVNAQGHATAKVVALSQQERVEELALSGLRLAAGLERARFRALTGRDVPDVVDAQSLAMLQGEGLVALDDQALRVTAQGRPLLNAILAKLLA